MAVTINGKIYRNVKGGSEGIDTPSLKINGEPISGGGTQLYKHTTSVIDDYDTTWTLVFITVSQTSLENQDLYDLNGQYIVGFVKYYSQYRSILSIYGDQEEPKIAYIDESGNLETITASGIYLGTDTVTAL